MEHGQRKVMKPISVTSFIKKTDIDYTLIREIATTTASLHDSQIDLSILRSPGERPHAVIKRVFNSGWVLVTTIRRVSVKMMVTAFAFNLYQLCTRQLWLVLRESID